MVAFDRNAFRRLNTVLEAVPVKIAPFDEFSDWIRHEGEEFLFVLSGSLLFYTEFYEPVTLNEGDSAYYDCTMGHALVSTSEQDAEVLWVTA